MKSSNSKTKSLNSQENERTASLPQLQRPMSGNDVIVIRNDDPQQPHPHHEKRVNLDQPIKVSYCNSFLEILFTI